MQTASLPRKQFVMGDAGLHFNQHGITENYGQGNLGFPIRLRQCILLSTFCANTSKARDEIQPHVYRLVQKYTSLSINHMQTLELSH